MYLPVILLNSKRHTAIMTTDQHFVIFSEKHRHREHKYKRSKNNKSTRINVVCLKAHNNVFVRQSAGVSSMVLFSNCCFFKHEMSVETKNMR